MSYVVRMIGTGTFSGCFAVMAGQVFGVSFESWIFILVAAVALAVAIDPLTERG